MRWFVDEFSDLGFVADEIFGSIVGTALPKIEQLGSLEAVMREFEDPQTSFIDMTGTKGTCFMIVANYILGRTDLSKKIIAEAKNRVSKGATPFFSDFWEVVRSIEPLLP